MSDNLALRTSESIPVPSHKNYHLDKYLLMKNGDGLAFSLPPYRCGEPCRAHVRIEGRWHSGIDQTKSQLYPPSLPLDRVLCSADKSYITPQVPEDSLQGIPSLLSADAGWTVSQSHCCCCTFREKAWPMQVCGLMHSHLRLCPGFSISKQARYRLVKAPGGVSIVIYTPMEMPLSNVFGIHGCFGPSAG